MSLPASIPAAIVDTILGRLATLFLTAANDDTGAARNLALHLLAGYNVQTEQELLLAAEIVSFSLHSLQALSQSIAADMPLNKIIRLRGSAVSLNREAHRGRKALEQLQRGQAAEAPQPRLDPAEHTDPQPDQAVERIEIAREAIERATRQDKSPKYCGLTWSQNHQKHLTATRMAEKSRRKAAEDLARLARAPSSPQTKQAA